MIECAFFGHLGRDAESKVSKAGKAYLRLAVRVGDAAQWINCTVFDPEAITAADKFAKGAAVYCEGSIKLDEWTAADGTARHGLSCMSWHTRLAQIGRNKPPKERKPVAARGDAGTESSHDCRRSQARDTRRPFGRVRGSLQGAGRFGRRRRV
jgi:single-stranded DNA-binding protein